MRDLKSNIMFLTAVICWLRLFDVLIVVSLIIFYFAATATTTTIAAGAAAVAAVADKDIVHLT